MRARLTFLLLGWCVALTACRSKPLKTTASTPLPPPPVERSTEGSPRPTEKLRKEPKQQEAVAKPKPAPAAPQPKPSIEPQPPAASKPSTTELPPTPPKPPPSGKEPEAPPVAVVPTNQFAKPAPAASPADVPRRSAPPPAVQEKVNRPPGPRSDPPPGKLATPVPQASSKTDATVPPSQPSANAPSTVPRTGGRANTLPVPAKPQPTVPAGPEPMRTAVPASARAQPKPAASGFSLLGMVGSEQRTRSSDPLKLSLPPGGGPTNASPASFPPLTSQFGQGTNNPPSINETSKSIVVDPLMQNGKGGVTWREQQRARQAAELKAREEEQRKLNDVLYRFLFKGGTNR